jgi:hypothetical protein
MLENSFSIIAMMRTNHYVNVRMRVILQPRYIFKVVIGEYWDGTKEVERGGEEAVASWADAAKGQGLRRGCAGGGRGAPDRIHMEGVA